MGNADGRSYYLPRYEAALSRQLREHVDALPVNGIVALLVDLGFLAEGGLAPIGEALEWSDAALGHRSPIVKLYAAGLLEKMRDPWLTPALARAKADIVARRVVPLARELGWLERRAEGDDTPLLRAVLLPFAAEREEGAPLRAEARRLALAWTTDREAVPASMTRAVLETAGRFAGEATYDRLEARTLAADDTRERGYLLSALAKARDPKLRARALALANDERVRPRDALGFVENALDDEHNRRVALDFVNANYAALSKKFPYHAVVRLMTPAGKLCTRDDRDAYAATFSRRVGDLEGGALRYRQSLESIDLCVAAHPSPRS
jgi:alanyl aminopeptidase